MDYREKLEIDLIDLCNHILKKWPLLVVCMVIGCILGSAVGYYKSVTVIDKSTGNPVTSAVSELDSLKSKLTDSSVTFVETLAEQYEDTLAEYKGLADHISKSPVFSTRNGKMVSCSERYYISDFSFAIIPSESQVNDADVVAGLDTVSSVDDNVKKIILSDANNIIDTYKAELLSEDVRSSIADTMNTETKYVEDIVRIYNSCDSILSITVYGEDEESCKKVMDIVTKDFDVVTNKIKSIYTYDIAYIGAYYYDSEDSYIVDKKYENAMKLNTLKSNISSMATNLTAEEKAYFTALIAGDTSEITEEKIETVVVRTFNKRYAVLGFFGGLFLASFCMAVLYIISGKCHTADDLRNVFGLSVLGEISRNASNLDIICQSATIRAEKLSAASTYLMGASDDEISVKYRTLIKDGIKTGDNLKSVKAGTSALNDAVSMKELSETDTAILVERIGYSAYEDIAREIELCGKFGVKVLGAVVVR